MCKDALRAIQITITDIPVANSCGDLLGTVFSVVTQRNGTDLTYLNETSSRSAWIKIQPPYSSTPTSRIPNAKVIMTFLPSIIQAKHGIFTSLGNIQLSVVLPTSVSHCTAYLAEGINGLWVDVDIGVEKGSILLDAQELTLFYPNSFKLLLKSINIQPEL